MNGTPAPKFGIFAPVYTPQGLIVFGRDPSSAQQVWSRNGGYPGDHRYRDFYRDIGYDLEYDYIKPYLPGDGLRSFTGIKYYKITGDSGEKLPYDREAALEAAATHARHFLDARIECIQKVYPLMKRPPVMVAPMTLNSLGIGGMKGRNF
jgi:1,4-alpha-glucan branching enzyme